MDKLLNICGTNILKSRIVGWKYSDDEKHNYCLDIVLDSGKSIKVIVQAFLYDNQREALEWAGERYQQIEDYLRSEFEIEQASDH